MRNNNRLLFRAVRAIVDDGDEAEDVMQEAYVRAYVHLAEFEGRARLSTWLVRIAINEAYARVKKRRRFTPTDPTDESGALGESLDGDDPEQLFADKQLGQVLEREIDRLPEVFRPAFVLRMVEHLSASEVASCLDITEETVRTRVFRARALLRRSILSQLDASATDAFGFHLTRCDRIVFAVLSRIRRH